MKKIFIILGVVILLVIAGFGAYFLLMTDESIVAEIVPTTKGEEKKVVATIKQGSFIKIDPVHYASGDVTVEKLGENYKVKIRSNFSSAAGPDLFVYLSEMQNFKNIALGGVNTGKTLNLGALKNLKGEQEYIVSKNDFEKYNSSIIIWCRQFGIQFSRADFK